MNNLDFLNNISDCVFAFSEDNKIIFKNSAFVSVFNDFKNFERFKQRFNFNLCFLSSENIKNITPIDLLLDSKENFHTICSYQNPNGEYSLYYIYKFLYKNYKVVILKNITDKNSLELSENRYTNLRKKYDEIKESAQKYTKLQEDAQSQMLKMGLINRISLVIRETNDLKEVLSSALNEIHNFMGSFKSYFSMKEKSSFKIKYNIPYNESELETITKYDDETLKEIRNKNIIVSACKKEYLNSDLFLQDGVNRIIIPVYNKNKLLGIIVTLTKQKFKAEENKEVLQSVSVHLGSTIIQAGLISQLNKKNKKLEKTLKELKETQLQLINTEKMASIGQLVSGVAHEINTPLASISSNNNLINKILLSNKINDRQLSMLKELNEIDIEAANRISNIVKSLKKFVRLDEAQFQEADINKEIDLTLKLIEHELKNISLEKHYSQLPPVKCSVNMINQVFMNLLVNSCHAIQQKGGKGIIKIYTGIDKNNLIVRIRDNGCGIPQDIQNKIFNTGYTTKKIGIGTGLGLSISKKITELHKGTITFESEENKGSEFKVTIPIKP